MTAGRTTERGPMRRAAAILAALLLSLAPAAAQEARLTAPGAPDALADRLRAGSQTLSLLRQAGAGDQAAPPRPSEVIGTALADYRTLVQLLYDAGQFSPVIHIRVDGREVSTIPPLNPPATIRQIEITVDPGPAFRFGQARIAPLARGTELPEDFAPGQPASTGTIRDAARAGIESWRAAGNAKAQVDRQTITADHSRAEIDADLRLMPGPVLRFGELQVDGNQRMRAAAIRRIAGLPTGETFDPSEVDRAERRLRRTGTFASVVLREDETPAPDGSLGFTAEVAEQKKRRLSFGAEIESGNGLTLSGSWLHRNLFGGAERFRVEGRLRLIEDVQSIDGALGLRLDRPGVPWPDSAQYFGLRADRQDEPHYENWEFYAATGFTYVFNDRLSGSLGVGLRRSRVTDAFGTRTLPIAEIDGYLTWDGRDDAVQPTRGVYLGAMVTPYLGLSDAAGSGAAATLDARAYAAPLAGGRVVLAGRLQLGSVLGSGLTDTSPSFLHYSGGAGTVRGQPYQSLGVTVPGGIVGGLSFLGASAEIRTALTDSIGLVGFFDYGRIGDGAFAGSDTESHSGAGLGLRYRISGLGALRLDVAMPVDPGGGDPQFYIGIGEAF